MIVTVKCEDQPHAHDLEVPAELPVSALIQRIQGTLGWETYGQACRLEAFPPGRALEPDETLAAAGVWDGAWLILSRAPDAEDAGAE